MESTIGLFKPELIKPRSPWRTVEQVEIAILEYVDWFNHRHLHTPAHGLLPGPADAGQGEGASSRHAVDTGCGSETASGGPTKSSPATRAASSRAAES